MIQTESEFLLCALRCYDNPKLIALSEFESDVKKFAILNTLLVRQRSGFPRERVIINYLVILSNTFGIGSVIDMIYYKISQANIPTIETFMYFLNIIEKPRTEIDESLLDKLKAL